MRISECGLRNEPEVIKQTTVVLSGGPSKTTEPSEPNKIPANLQTSENDAADEDTGCLLIADCGIDPRLNKKTPVVLSGGPSKTTETSEPNKIAANLQTSANHAADEDTGCLLIADCELTPHKPYAPLVLFISM